jgi:hypothetical protein
VGDAQQVAGRGVRVHVAAVVVGHDDGDVLLVDHARLDH